MEKAVLAERLDKIDLEKRMEMRQMEARERILASKKKQDAALETVKTEVKRDIFLKSRVR